ncbi:MAG: cytochrome c-type biogenesis protein [Cypionkella sp.]|nr:cytochrome c-type biogenesis protein [Cypionkella sp.]
MRIFLILLAFLAFPAFAVQPDEILPDPALEARARAITTNLRCPVCQGESIDDSNAPISRDLRLAVRERITMGDSDAQVIDYVTARYGEFVLFKPRTTGSGLILWLAGPLMLLAGAGIAFATLRRRQAAPELTALTREEAAELENLLK